MDITTQIKKDTKFYEKENTINIFNDLCNGSKFVLFHRVQPLP